MIIFKKVRFKNLLSVGKNFAEFDLNSNSNLLVYGKSGSGKSTIIEAITFALFGRAYRDATKGQIVNSINKKGLVVELEFNDYKIVRGISPDKFEIWHNDTLVEKTADAREYQADLEKDILKMDYKTFTQIVVLGSAAFTPFMKLKAQERRQVIEELLDLQIFTLMNKDVKKKVSSSKVLITEYEKDIASIKSSISTYEDVLERNKETNDNFEDNKKKKISSIKEKVLKLNKSKKEIDKELSNIEEKLVEFAPFTNDGLDNIKEKTSGFYSEAKIIKTTLDNVMNNDHCPTCKQDIGQDHKESINKEYGDALSKFKEKYTASKGSAEAYTNKLEEKEKLNRKKSKCLNDISDIDKELKFLQKEYKSVNEEKPSFDTSEIEANIETKKEELAKIEKKYDAENKKLKSLNKALTYLKDDGIKKVIIDKYIPILNMQINKYLEQFDLFVAYELDAEFKETIKSRHRDKFTYTLFSEGQKKRIDFSIMMAFREIAKMRNSVSCNLLVVDELLDGLDNDNVDNLEAIIAGFSGTNTLFISHSEDLKNRAVFDRVYKAELMGNFTNYEELS